MTDRPAPTAREWPKPTRQHHHGHAMVGEERMCCATTVPWEDVPANNRHLMTAVCAEVGQLLRAAVGANGDGGAR